MGFRINTNIGAMNAHRNATQTNIGLDKSLTSLSSGLRINKAADELVFTYGVRGWNMNDCAQEAGITKRTLYRYIDSKEQLVEMVLKRFIRKTQLTLASALEKEEDFQSISLKIK